MSSNAVATLKSRRGHSAKKSTTKGGTSQSLTKSQQQMLEDSKRDQTMGQAGQTAGQGTEMQTKNLLTKRAKKPAYLQSLNESEKAENFKIIDNMNKKISYLKNPRHKVNKAPILMTVANQSKPGAPDSAIKDPSFDIEPSTVNFEDYQVNGIYEYPVKITNKTAVLKRIKFIPPTSENFTVRKVVYPSKITGDVAPGMSLMLYVTFCAPSFADFDDSITFVTEENSFKLPLRARREPPSISLVNPLDCLHSWLGDRVDMAFRCINNGGDGGFKFFCEKDEDDSKQMDADTIRIGSFTLTPSEFYLYSGNAIDIYVSFQPDKEGQLDENLILACDNQTSEFYKLTGYGAMLDLDIIAVDGKAVDFKKNPFETIYFENTNPTSEIMRTIRIKNTSPIVVPYHWSVYKQKNSTKISLQDEETHYRVTPNQGRIQGGEEIDFQIYFCPGHAEPYFEFVDLIVEDIPIQSVRNPPEGLKNFAAANTTKSKMPMPTYVGSNTQFLSIPMQQFNLRGQGNSCKVEIDPPFCFFEGDTYINHEYIKKVQLKKKSEGQVKYTITLEGKNSETFDVDLRTQGKSIKEGNGKIEGIMESSEMELDLELIVQSPDCGDKLAYFYIQIQDGAPISFQCRATFQGPIIKLVEPIVDFGLVKINSQQEFRINIINTSPIPAEICIKNSKNKRLNFNNMMKQDESDMKDISTASLMVGSFKTAKGNLLSFDNAHRILEPNEEIQVLISLDSIRWEDLLEYFEIMVKDSRSMFFKIMSCIQAPRLCLNREYVGLGRIYAGVPEVINHDGKYHKQHLVLKNYGNLPAKYKWEEVNDPERMIIRFDPPRGTIPPHSEIKVAFQVICYIGGQLDELLICDVEDYEVPIGFSMRANAYGLNVAYEQIKEDTSGKMEKTTVSPRVNTMRSANEHSDIVSAVGSMFNRGLNLDALKSEQAKLENLNFPSCIINKVSTQKFLIKNLSGIKSHFRFSAKEFEPQSQEAPKQLSEVEKAMLAAQKREKELADQMSEQDTFGQKKAKKQKQIRFAESAKGGFGATGQSTIVMRKKAILSDEHEKTQKFQSKNGDTMTKTNQLEKDMTYYLSNNKGIAVVFTPYEGELLPNSEIAVTVSIYNNICGKFDDKIYADVKGLPRQEFPVSINISGSPVVIPPNQVGLNYNTIPPTLPMPTIVTNSQTIQKTFKIKNSGLRSIQIDWKIFDQQDLVQKENDLFKVDIIKNLSFDKKDNPFKFNLSVIEPEESKSSAFEISPKSIVVGSRSVEHFTVTFNSHKGLGQFKSIVLANPELSQEEIEITDEDDDILKKGALGIVALNLNATTINPKLSIDRKLKLDGEKHMSMKYWSWNQDPDAPKQVQKLTFTNETKADMVFNLSLNGPFEIVKTKSNTGAKHPMASSVTPSKHVKPKVETMFALQPLKIVEVHVKFLTPQPTNTEEWPMTIKNERKGEIIAHFANGDSQKLFLDGLLLRPMVELLTEKPSKNDKAMDEMDFGTVNIDKFRTIRVFLSNTTEVTARWQLGQMSFPKKSTLGYNTTTPWEVENEQKTDDKTVFDFSCHEGVLKGRSEPLRKVPEGLFVPPVPKDENQRQYLPQEILIRFRPKANVLYKSRFRIQVDNGINCDFILKGKGSYEENYD